MASQRGCDLGHRYYLPQLTLISGEAQRLRRLIFAKLGGRAICFDDVD
jgi:hypothetical protein